MDNSTCRPLMLTDGSVAWVDTADYPSVRQSQWYPHSFGYAYRMVHQDGQRRMLCMHTQITGYQETDHWNGRKRDNRRSNLRDATHAQNLANKGKQRGVYTSRFKGVSWSTRRSRWEARLSTRTGPGPAARFLGYFEHEIDAARAYDVGALQRWGEFARPNFPGEG